MDKRKLTVSLALALAFASPGALAFGLGQLQVKSGLNQPLVAEIPIISATASEIERLDVRLASPEAFARVGLEPPGELTANLQFSIGKNSRGEPVIRVTTANQFAEPLLSFLIEANWGKGQVTREYTALIDPPYIAPAVIQPMLTPSIAAQAPPPRVIAPPVAEVVREPTPVETAPAPEPMPAPVMPAPEPKPQPIVQFQAPAPLPAAEPAPAPTPAPEPQAMVPAIPAPAPEPVAPEATKPGEYGPVAPGQTLSEIADSLRPAPVSLNQMMVALLRANPEAFGQDNINVLKRGAVLRVPGQDEVDSLSRVEAAALVSQQISAWRSQREPVPQPAESAVEQPTPASPAPDAPRVAEARTRRSASRLEIVPPSGDPAARSAQSGAAAGAGGAELRAELALAREDLASRASEVTELQARVVELEKQDSDRQRLIEMQNSQMKDLQDRLAQVEKTPDAAAVAATAIPVADGGASAIEAKSARPWYLDPYLMIGAVVLLLGGLVLGLRRSKSAAGDEPSPRRLSDDDALRASIARTREASEKIAPVAAPVAEPTVVPAPSGDAQMKALRDAVRDRPQDMEAHLSLLRLIHSRGHFAEFEAAAQDMRAHIPNTMDPRWREAVIMGASLMPANSKFAQAGWNAPRTAETDAQARAAAMPSRQPVAPVTPPVPVIVPVPVQVAAPASPVKVFEIPEEDALDIPSPPPALADDSLDFGDHGHAFSGGPSSTDVHRNEAQMLAEDEASATRIELAKAYLDIGDLDGARSMLEEVVAEGGPTAQAEAGRILREIG